MKSSVKILTLIIYLIISKYSFTQTDTIDINIILMNSTFLISGDGYNTCGSGFILLRNSKIYPGKSTNLDVVFITAAHVLDSINGNIAYIYYREKINNIYQTVPCPIRIRNKKTNFYTKHPTMDVAAMLITLLPNFNYNEILNETWLANDSDLINYKVQTGETINCLGYPLCISDTLGNFPILRSGKIASYPIVPSNIYKTFYFDFEVNQGNSGGPVYFFEDGSKSRAIGKDLIKMGGRNVQFIMGIVTQARYAYRTDYSGAIKDTIDLKIGVVVQSRYILETINMIP